METELFFHSSSEDMLTFAMVEHLEEAEVAAPEILHVVFLQSSLDHVRRVVLAGELQGEQTKENL